MTLLLSARLINRENASDDPVLLQLHIVDNGLDLQQLRFIRTPLLARHVPKDELDHLWRLFPIE